MVVGLGAFGWYFFAARAEAKVVANDVTGAYSVKAAPGLGYQYRWDENGDGKWDSEKYGDKTEISFELKPTEVRTVRLEVQNAFGNKSEREIRFERPKVDMSGASSAESGRPDAARGKPLRPPPGTPGIPSGFGQPRPQAPDPARPRMMPPDKVQ
jgi:hypothetical protein